MKSLAMSIRTTRGVFLVRDIKSVYYVKQPGVPTIYFINEDGREASVPFEEVICFAMCETDNVSNIYDHPLLLQG